MKQIDLLSFLKEMEEPKKEVKKKDSQDTDAIKELEQTLWPADEKCINIGELFTFQKKKYVYLGVEAENSMASWILAVRPKDLKKCRENKEKYIQKLPIKEKELEKLNVPLCTMPGRCTGYWLHFPECEELTIGNEIEQKEEYTSPAWLSKRKTKRIAKELLSCG